MMLFTASKDTKHKYQSFASVSVGPLPLLKFPVSYIHIYIVIQHVLTM